MASSFAGLIVRCAQGRASAAWCLALLCASACLDSPESTAKAKGAQSASLVGALMPFGGVDGTCVVVAGSGPHGGLQVGACSDDRAKFLFDASSRTIRPVGDAMMCWDVLYGNLSAGEVGQVTCHGGSGQQFDVSGGQVTARMTSGGQQYCLDAHGGAHEPGTSVGLAPCNGSPAQSFLPAGYKIGIATEPENGGPALCLSAPAGSAHANARIELSPCTRAARQTFTLDRSLLLRPANTGLCVAASSLPQGLGTLSLQTCNADDGRQQWTFENAGRYPNLKAATRVYAGTNSCIVARSASSAQSSGVGVASCGGQAAQSWRPFFPTLPNSL